MKPFCHELAVPQQDMTHLLILTATAREYAAQTRLVWESRNTETVDDSLRGTETVWTYPGLTDI